MSMHAWMDFGWLWKKNGKLYAHCDNCNKNVEVNYCCSPLGESDECICRVCGEEVLSD